MRVLGFALVIVTATLAVPLSGDAASPKPSWTCISGICLGNSRDALDYRFGTVAPDLPSREIHVQGGRVRACFWRCTDAVTEDGFTHYGGTQRPANNALTVSTCDRVVRLPDRVSVGQRIPFGTRWNGYRQIRMEGSAFGWEARAGGVPSASRSRSECRRVA